jgi:hypothetical protein
MEQTLARALPLDGFDFSGSVTHNRCVPPWAGINETGNWRRRSLRCAATAAVTTVDVESASRGDHLEASGVKLITQRTLYLGPQVASTH